MIYRILALIVIAMMITLILSIPKLAHSETISIEEVMVIEAENKPQTVEEMINQYDWDTSIALQIAKYESGLNVRAANRNDRHKTCTGSFGVMQLGCFWLDEQESYDPVKNIAKAYEIYSSQGRSFRAWSTCKKISGCK